MLYRFESSFLILLKALSYQIYYTTLTGIIL
jgi:hypothetical protein